MLYKVDKHGFDSAFENVEQASYPLLRKQLVVMHHGLFAAPVGLNRSVSRPQVVQAIYSLILGEWPTGCLLLMF